MRQKRDMVGGGEGGGVRTRGSIPGPGIGMRWGGVGVRCVSEGEKGTRKDCVVWREGGREPEEKNQSVTKEKTWVRKGVYQIGHMHLCALLSCIPLDCCGDGQRSMDPAPGPLHLAVRDHLGQPSPFAERRD